MVAALLLLLVGFGIPVLMPDAAIFGVLGGIALGLVIVLWWLFFSRAPWSERLGALVLMIVAVFATRPIVHESIRGGMMGRMLFVFSIPVLSLALVAWAVASRRLSTGPRRASMVAAILLGCGVFTLVRTGGISGEGISDIHWRWTKTPEERLLAQASEEPAPLAPPPAATAPVEPPARAGESPAATPPSAPPAVKAPEKGREARANDKPAAIPPVLPVADTRALWPGFRGPNRDSAIRGVLIDTDWSKSPPVELWRRPIGPGWSSFAVRGDLVYTQEQRGNDENVSCYNLTTGKLVWRHRDAVRFYESNGGAGPRSTPTVHNGRVYTLGATGIVNALDASNGTVVWSRNAKTDTGAPLPGWGFAGSPLVFDDLVIVATSGRLAGYDAATGNPRWTHTTGGGGYSSPHLVTIDGVRQILLLSGGGVTSVSPADGTRLWQHSGAEGVSIVQPAFAAAGDVLVAAGDMMGGTGIRRIAVSQGSSGWTVEERWTSRGLKPYFNDFVVHKAHAFGFDGSILSCINLENGERKWKGGRYGAGQMVLLPDQEVLLVLSEEGELALVKATPDQFTEVARFKAIEGKTWNHPVLVGNVLLVRNGEEMAAFRLSVEGT
ncbi:MAG: PQQ-binding-like beta-propeller repeat protein [Vicinamibacterales bacterium]